MRGIILLLVLCSVMLVKAQPQIHESFERFNMVYDEQNPVLSPDGTMLIFTISNHPKNIGGAADPGDIWYMLWTGAEWSEPKHGGSLINNRAYNSSIGFSADGSTVYLLGHYANAGSTATTQGISSTSFNHGNWSKPHNISIPYFQNRSNLQSGYITPDGTVFVYSAETYGSYGVEDIYVTVKRGDGWAEPKNLGRTINTSFQELSPSLSEDKNTLYFSTNGRKGSGSFDIYASTRLDDSWANWTEPVNLGQATNTDGRELYYKVYGELALFTSTKNSDGYGNIKFYLPPNAASPVLVASPPLQQEEAIVEEKPVEPLPGVTVLGKVTNIKTGEEIKAKLIFEAQDVIQVVEAGQTGFKIQLAIKQNYSVKVEAPGYINEVKNLDISKYDMSNLETIFTLQPIEIGTTVVLKHILFKQSKPELLPDSYNELNEVADFLKANPTVEIELSGHTDNRGSFRQLLSLSQQRVNRVKTYLVSKGVESKRISGKGYGGQKPVASNDTEESRALNRRVEFTIKKK
jgi:OmpA-OmpF porin, OOP family